MKKFIKAVMIMLLLVLGPAKIVIAEEETPVTPIDPEEYIVVPISGSKPVYIDLDSSALAKYTKVTITGTVNRNTNSVTGYSLQISASDGATATYGIPYIDLDTGHIKIPFRAYWGIYSEPDEFEF